MNPFNDTYVMYQLLEFIDESSIIALCKASKKLNEICKQYIEMEDDKRFRFITINNASLEKYCIDNDVIKIRKLIKMDINFYWDRGLYGACRSGHLDIVKLMIEKGACDWSGGLHTACKYGHLDTVKLIIKKGARDWNRDWNWGLFYACRGGNIDIVKLMIEKGGNCWNWGLNNACKGGHINIIKLMIEKGAYRCNYCNKSVEKHF